MKINNIIEDLENSNINQFLNKDYKIYAHKKENIKELLEEHVELCKKYFKLIMKKKKFYEILSNLKKNILKECSEEANNLFIEMFLNVIVLHDIGKINVAFQKVKMDNDLKIKGTERCRDSKHSIYSSLLYIDIFLEKVLKLSKRDQEIIIPVILLNSYVISRHHSSLNNFNEFIESLREITDEGVIVQSYEPIERLYYKEIRVNQRHINVLNKKFNKFIERNVKEKDKSAIIGTYIYERFLLSILVACDYYATSEFQNGIEINNLGILSDINEFYNIFKEGKIYKSIKEYEVNFYEKEKDLIKIKDINILRNEMFLEAEKTLIEFINKNIFYLEAPTGGGKSNIANNLAFKILERDENKDKIIYVYPFNTLVEQNLETLSKIYRNNKGIMDKISVINSLYPIKMAEIEDDNYDFYKYEKALLNRQFLNYPMILTTHVSLFNYLFGSNREDIFALHQLANSVIIFDEIQSYKNKIWREIIEFLNVYSELLNIKVIIMSATLPKLENLIQGKTNSVNLIKEREKYFSHDLFKNRVKINYDLLKADFNFDLLTDKIQKHKGKKILIEFIKKSSAYEFFELLNENKENLNIKSKLLLLTGDDNLAERKKVIDKVSKYNDVILIATQVIEAGVDIDMDMGMKDISLFDSEEQFLGRINRSCLKSDAIVYFFNKDKASDIYKGDIRIQESLSISNERMREILINKSFDKYYEEINKKLLDITSKNNRLNTEEFFNCEVGGLLFKNISEKMKLIDEKNNDITVFLNSIVEVNGEILVGSEIWKSYERLLKNNKLNYSEKVVKLSQVKSKMSNFLYRIRTNYNFSYSDRIGDILYIEEGENYFINGKLDRKKFESNIGEFI